MPFFDREKINVCNKFFSFICKMRGWFYFKLNPKNEQIFKNSRKALKHEQSVEQTFKKSIKKLQTKNCVSASVKALTFSSPLILKLCVVKKIYVSRKLSKFSFLNCQNFPFQTVKIFIFKLSKFSFSNCQNFPFSNCQNFLLQTVKIFLFQTVKIFFFKMSKFSFSNCQNFPFQSVKIFLFKVSKFSFSNCQNFSFQTVKIFFFKLSEEEGNFPEFHSKITSNIPLKIPSLTLELKVSL
jgi:hypothetical protein